MKVCLRSLGTHYLVFERISDCWSIKRAFKSPLHFAEYPEFELYIKLRIKKDQEFGKIILKEHEYHTLGGYDGGTENDRAANESPLNSSGTLLYKGNNVSDMEHFLCVYVFSVCFKIPFPLRVEL